jgi:hypothetical protein
MFRRKTDQVYSTLQQVQRRMTNQTESGQSQSATRSKSRSAYGSGTGSHRKPVGRPATLGPFTTPTVKHGDDPALEGQEVTPSPVEDPLFDPNVHEQPLPQNYGQGILLTFPMLCVMLVLWVLSIAVAYTLGPGDAGTVLDPGIEQAAGPAGTGPIVTRSPDRTNVGPVVPSRGRDVLVLKSVLKSSNQAIEEFKSEAAHLNKVASRNPDKLKPYFGVRLTSANGLQLIFGVKDGVTGIDKEKYQHIKRIMEIPKSKKGPGYSNPYWISLD